MTLSLEQRTIDVLRTTAEILSDEALRLPPESLVTMVVTTRVRGKVETLQLCKGSGDAAACFSHVAALAACSSALAESLADSRRA